MACYDLGLWNFSAGTGSQNFCYGIPYQQLYSTGSTIQVGLSLYTDSLCFSGFTQDGAFSDGTQFFDYAGGSNQEILSIPTTNLAGVDFTIISTQPSANIRNITKMSAVLYGSTVNYVEFSTLPVNGYIGDFSINYFPGNITSDPALVLKLSPQSADLQSHKMQITTYQV